MLASKRDGEHEERAGGLTFAAAPRKNSLSPQQMRRNKLVAHLREKISDGRS